MQGPERINLKENKLSISGIFTHEELNEIGRNFDKFLPILSKKPVQVQL